MEKEKKNNESAKNVVPGTDIPQFAPGIGLGIGMGTGTGSATGLPQDVIPDEVPRKDGPGGEGGA